MSGRNLLVVVVFGMMTPDAAACCSPSILPNGAVALRRPLSQSAVAPVTVRLRVVLPDEAAELAIDGHDIPGYGTTREIVQPVGVNRILTLVWRPNTYTTISRTLMLPAGAGPLTVDLTVASPGDHVDVRYVPTPTYLVREMIELAGIGPDDVVFEPGCGDARVLIAAMRAGARRGIGIDLDTERVNESKRNVRDAGLQRRVTIRHGDALSIPDIASATVVFLYMGEEFNSLIKPLLLRHLRPGARVISHRFTMGDWVPDKTVTVPDETGTAQVHLWTIKPRGLR